MSTQTVEDKVRILKDDFIAGKLSLEDFQATVKTLYMDNGLDEASADRAVNMWVGIANQGQTPLEPAPPSDKKFWEDVGFPETDPQAAWQRGMGVPATGQNPFQEWLSNQSRPAFAGWGARAAAVPLGVTPIPGQAGQIKGNPFSDYISHTGAESGRRVAYETLNQMRSQGGEKQQNWMDTVGSKGGPGLEEVLNAAMRGKGYAGFVADSMANRLPALRTGWNAQTMGGANAGTEPGNTLLDYLMRNLGL